MLCRKARAALVERELERPGPERDAALARHLRGCVDCALEARRGDRMREELMLLRGQVPFEVNVTTRVMAQVNALGRPVADEIPLGQWVLASVAAVACGVVILGVLWELLPGLVGSARDAIALMAGARGVATTLAASMVSLLAIPFKLLGALLSSLMAMAPMLERLAPLGVALAALSMGSMSVTVMYFVGRDLRARPLREEP